MEKHITEMENKLALSTRQPDSAALVSSTNEWKREQERLRRLELEGLIQMSRRRAGLHLLEDSELDDELWTWENVLREIPGEYLQRCYRAAASVWDWLDDRKQFTAEAIKAQYSDLVRDDRAQTEKERREAQRRNPGTVACWHCGDLGYQTVYFYTSGLWYCGSRACQCDVAPAAQRQPAITVDPRTLTDGHWRRSQTGEYARVSDLKKYGPPNSHFTDAAPPESPRRVFSRGPELRAMLECDHDYRYEPEPPGSFYEGFDVCHKCAKAKPHLNGSLPERQKRYLQMARDCRDRNGRPER